MAKLFGLFSKIRDKRVENPLGVGLGLAICKQLVELMRGQIHVTSVYGQGTKFFFTAIHGRSNDKEAAAAMKERDLAHKKVQGGAEVQERDTGRVLVVEDNEFNMEVVRCMLENEGNLVSLATNGQEACEAYQAAVERSEPFEVIFMDCNMPVLDGYEATKKIRKMQAEREKAPSAKGGASYVPVVALTAYAMPGDKEKCLNAGMDDYITKPVNKDVLLSTLGKHLKEGRRRAAEAKQAQARLALCFLPPPPLLVSTSSPPSPIPPSLTHSSLTAPIHPFPPHPSCTRATRRWARRAAPRTGPRATGARRARAGAAR